jgi:hypothetical protein
LKRIFTRRSDARRLALLGIVTGSVVAASAAAQETGGPTPQQLARDRENPFAQTINLPLAAVTGFGIGPHHDVGEQLTIQPQLPLPLDADWNLIVRSLLPMTFSPDPQRRFGLGDVQPSFFLTPARSTGLIWGAGPAFQFPTATNNELGTGKWSAGPTGALVYSDSEGPWFAGILLTQLWSFAGAPRTQLTVMFCGRLDRAVDAVRPRESARADRRLRSRGQRFRRLCRQVHGWRGARLFRLTCHRLGALRAPMGLCCAWAVHPGQAPAHSVWFQPDTTGRLR